MYGAGRVNCLKHEADDYFAKTVSSVKRVHCLAARLNLKLGSCGLLNQGGGEGRREGGRGVMACISS